MVSTSRRAGPPQAGQVTSIERRQLRQGGAALPGDGDVQGQDHGQVLLRHRHQAAFLAINDGDGRPPVALPGDEPVPEAEVHRPLALALLFQEAGDGLLGRGAGQAGEWPESTRTPSSS